MLSSVQGLRTENLVRLTDESEVPLSLRFPSKFPGDSHQPHERTLNSVFPGLEFVA